MAQTKIEWADEVLSVEARLCENNFFDQLCRCLKALFFDPSINVFIVFGAITGCASRNDIPWRCLSTLANGNYVIPRCCNLFAIGATSPEIFKKHFFSTDRYWVNIPFSGVRVLASFRSIGNIGLVFFSVILIPVMFAQSALNLFFWQPFLTLTTIRKTFFCHLFICAPIWSLFTRFCIGTFHTFGRMSIRPGAIFVKILKQFPLLAFRTMPKSRLDFSKIFLDGQSKSTSCYFLCTDF